MIDVVICEFLLIKLTKVFDDFKLCFKFKIKQKLIIKVGKDFRLLLDSQKKSNSNKKNKIKI